MLIRFDQSPNKWSFCQFTDGIQKDAVDSAPDVETAQTGSLVAMGRGMEARCLAG